MCIRDGADRTLEAAKRLGFPVLAKAVAGGGGRGLRLVQQPQDLPEEVDAAAREALAAFGDGRVLLEEWLPSARHIEVQILGDHHGEVVHLFERECSIQRRHQKLIEETPSPAIDAEQRERITNSAVTLATAVGYRNAGTVEFLLAPDGRQLPFEVARSGRQVHLWLAGDTFIFELLDAPPPVGVRHPAPPPRGQSPRSPARSSASWSQRERR